MFTSVCESGAARKLLVLRERCAAGNKASNRRHRHSQRSISSCSSCRPYAEPRLVLMVMRRPAPGSAFGVRGRNPAGWRGATQGRARQLRAAESGSLRGLAAKTQGRQKQERRFGFCVARPGAARKLFERHLLRIQRSALSPRQLLASPLGFFERRNRVRVGNRTRPLLATLAPWR